MINMSDINDIRDLAHCGYRISEIHKKTGMDPKTIKKYITKEDFSLKQGHCVGRPTILEPYKPVIAAWLEEDRQHWAKQQHTAKRVYDRLVAEKNYKGSYDTVQKYMKGVRREQQHKASHELIWDPGYAQVDFGEADFYEDNTCVRRKYLVVSFPFSNDGYIQLFGGETAECVCQGLKDMRL